MGWLSDLFSGGSSSSSSSSSNDDGPSPAPTPTVVKTGTTLKTGTVLNNDDDPVVFTSNDDGGFTGQNQSTLPAATTDDDKSFGEVFSENRAAGEDTFVYNGEVYTTDLAPDTPAPAPAPAAPTVSYDAFGKAYDTPAAAAQADQVAEAQAAAAQNAIAAETDRIFDPRGDQIQSPTSNGAGIASLGEDDLMSQTVVGAAGQDYADSLPDFSYDFTADDGGSSPLPDDNVVADASGGFTNYIRNLVYGEDEQSGPGFDAFGTEYATEAQAAQADVDMNNAAVMANNPNFEAQFPGDVPEGMISSSADIAPDQSLAQTMFFDRGESFGMDALRKLQSGFFEASAGKVGGGSYAGDRALNQMSSPGNTVGQIFSQQTGQGRFLTPGSESDLEALIGKYAGQPVSTGTELQDAFAPTVGRLEKKAAGYDEQISPAMRERVRNAAANPAPGMEGKDMLGRPFGTDAAATALIGVGELGDTAADALAIAAGSAANVASRGLTLPLSIAAVGASSGAEAGGAARKDALAQFDAALSSGQIDGIEGKSDFEIAKIRQELGSTAFNNAGLVASLSDPLIAGTLVAGKGITSLFKVPQFNNVLANAGLKYTGQVVTATGGEGITGATEQILGVNKPLIDVGVQGMNMSDGAYAAGLNEMLGGGISSAAITPVQAAAGAVKDRFVVDSKTKGQPAQSNVPTSYDGAQLGDGTDPMATSMEAMAAQQIIEDQVSQFGVVDQSILNRLQQSTGLSMQELGAMEASATSTRLTPDQIAAIESAPVGDIMTTAPVSPNLADEVTGIGGGSNISVRPNPDGTITLTNPSGLETVVESGQSLDEAIQVFDEITTPIDAQTEALKLQAQEEAAAMSGARDVTSTPFTSVRREGISSLPAASDIDAAPELTTIYHATKGAPFSQFDPTQGDSYYGNQGAFGPGFYGSLDTKYPSEFVGGEGSLMSAQVDTSNMLDARNKKPLSQTQTANLQGALANRTDSAGNNLNVTQDGNTLTVEYVRKSSFADESEADRTVTRTIDTTNPTDVFQKVNIISENIKNPLAKDDRGLSIESELDGDTQNLKGILTDAGFTGVVGVADVGGGTAGNKDNMVVFDESLVGALQTVVDQGPIPTSAADLAIDKKMDADNAAPAIEKEDVAAVVEVGGVDSLEEFRERARSDLEKSKTINNTILSTIESLKSNGLTEEAAAYEAEANAIAERNLKARMASSTGTVATEELDANADKSSVTVVEKDGDSKTTRKTGAAVTETDTGATVELAADQTAATDQTAAEQAAADAAADAASAAASETQTASTADIVTYTDVEEDEEEEEVEVEVEDEVEDTGGDVTVDVDEDDTFVPVITSTDENGDTITECPEGYVMVEGPDGPMCQKSVTTTVRRQRAGAGTRAYTGLSGNRGRVGPGQRSRSNTTTTTETVDPTTRSA